MPAFDGSSPYGESIPSTKGQLDTQTLQLLGLVKPPANGVLYTPPDRPQTPLAPLQAARMPAPPFWQTMAAGIRTLMGMGSGMPPPPGSPTP